MLKYYSYSVIECIAVAIVFNYICMYVLCLPSWWVLLLRGRNSRTRCILWPAVEWCVNDYPPGGVHQGSHLVLILKHTQDTGCKCGHNRSLWPTDITILGPADSRHSHLWQFLLFYDFIVLPRRRGKINSQSGWNSRTQLRLWALFNNRG